MASTLPPLLELEQQRKLVELEIEKVEKRPAVLALHRLQLEALRNRREQLRSRIAELRARWH
jgi:hypothetical protein